MKIARSSFVDRYHALFCATLSYSILLCGIRTLSFVRSERRVVGTAESCAPVPEWTCSWDSSRTGRERILWYFELHNCVFRLLCNVLFVCNRPLSRGWTNLGIFLTYYWKVRRAIFNKFPLFGTIKNANFDHVQFERINRLNLKKRTKTSILSGTSKTKKIYRFKNRFSSNFNIQLLLMSNTM